MLTKGKTFSPDEVWYNKPVLYEYDGLKPTKGEIGMEIECEGTNLFTTPISYWRTEIDNSLRPYKDHPPIEYILKGPLARDKVPEALNYLVEKLKSAGSFIAESSRTSVHVHINCQELNMKQITTFVCLWMIFEDLLTEFCGPSRVGNLFCLRARDAEGFVMAYEEAIRSGGEVKRDIFNEQYRYYGCNIASVGKYGSLEFRTMKGTVDPVRILEWVSILCHIKDESVQLKSPQDVINSFEALDPDQFIRAFFPDKFHSILKIEGYHSKMWDGARMARDIAFAIHEWVDALPLVDIVIPKFHPDDPRGTPIACNPSTKNIVVTSPIGMSLVLRQNRVVFEKVISSRTLEVKIIDLNKKPKEWVEYVNHYHVPIGYVAGQHHRGAVSELVSRDAVLYEEPLPSSQILGSVFIHNYFDELPDPPISDLNEDNEEPENDF